MAFTNNFTLILLLFVIAQLFHFSAPRVVPVNEAGFNPRDGGDRNVSGELFNSLEELARIVDISYCVGSVGVSKPFECLSHCSDFQGFELVTTWNTGPLLSDSCGYIALSHPPFPERIIVAFRGTYSIANTIVDLSAYQQEYAPYTGDKEGEGTPRCLNCTVHAGFLASWNNTRSVVLSYVTAAREQYPDYDVVLVGHSLGGAVATLAGLEMQLKGWKPQVTTFGEPRVGNEGFAKFLDKSFGLSALHHMPGDELRFRRVTHVQDPIPLLPMEEWGYKMHAGEIFISKQSLSPSIYDLQLCDGNQDENCISGSESPLREMLNELSYIDAFEKERRLSDDNHDDPGEQTVLMDQEQLRPAANCQNEPFQMTSSPFSLSWNPIPPRYRLWELFFAHRDYFWRLGLCFPGGDPSVFDFPTPQSAVNEPFFDQV